jgi:hypothetical protein
MGCPSAPRYPWVGPSTLLPCNDPLSPDVSLPSKPPVLLLNSEVHGPSLRSIHFRRSLALLQKLLSSLHVGPLSSTVIDFAVRISSTTIQVRHLESVFASTRDLTFIDRHAAEGRGRGGWVVDKCIVFWSNGSRSCSWTSPPTS